MASSYGAHANENLTEQLEMRQAATLDDFISATVASLGLDPGFRIPGLSDLENVQITPVDDFLPQAPSYSFEVQGQPASISLLNGQSADQPVFLLSIKNIGFSTLIPGVEDTPLGVFGAFPDAVFIISPTKQPEFDLSSLGNIPVLPTLQTAKETISLQPGVTLIAEVEIRSVAPPLRDALKILKLADTTILPIRASLGPNALTKLPSADLGKSANIRSPSFSSSIQQIGSIKSELGADFIQNLKITADLSKGLTFGDLNAPSALFSIKGADVDGVSVEIEAPSFSLLGLTGTELQIALDLESGAHKLSGALPKDAMFPLVDFKGLVLGSADLAATYSERSWDFRLAGEAQLNGATAAYDVEVRSEGGTVDYIATLDGGDRGITAADVAGGAKLAGLDQLKLEAITVTKADLIADLSFAGVSGEIAAFHPEGYQDAVMAVTLDSLGFGDLIPGASGTPLEGVSIDGLTLMMVPPGGKKFGVEEATLPPQIQSAISKILKDSQKPDDQKFQDGINFFAEFDLKASANMVQLMQFVGMEKKTILPVSGVLGPMFFDATATPEMRHKGMDLSLPMPKINLASLPGAFQLTAPEFKVTDVSPDGVEGLWTGIKSGVSANLMGQDLEFSSNIGFSDTALSMKAVSDTPFPAPFGVEWLALKDLALEIDFDEKLKTGSFEFKAVTADPFGKTNPKVSIELTEAKGELTAGLIRIDEEIAFTDVPILQAVPHAEQFSFEFLEISTDGIAGGTKLHGVEVEAAVFRNGQNWVFAVADHGGDDGYKFSRIMPPLKGSPLADFHLKDAALIFSPDPIKGSVSDLPQIAQQMLGKIYGGNTALVNVAGGITVVANFSPGNTGGTVAEALDSIGIASDLLIEGTLENIFSGGVPSVAILTQIAQGPGSAAATHSPKMLNYPEQVGFFIDFNPTNFQFGIQSDVVLKLPKDEQLDLISKLEIGLDEKGYNIGILLDLEGEWHEPLGVPGIVLEQVALKFGINPVGEVIFGFAGQSEIGDVEIDLAAEIDFLLEAEGLPDGIAIKGSIEELDFEQIVKLATSMANAGLKAGEAAAGKTPPPKVEIAIPSNIPLPDVKNLEFAFATPGSTDPDLGLTNPGVLMKADLYLGNFELGSTVTSVGPSGIYLNDKIADIKLDGLVLKNNQITLDIGYLKPPEFKIDTMIDFFGVEENAEVKFKEGIFEIVLQQKIHDLFEADFLLAFGVDVHDGGMPLVYMAGQVSEGFDSWALKEVPEKLSDFFTILDRGYEDAVKKIKDAEQEVQSLRRKIDARKEQLQRERNRADRALDAAKRKVDRLRSNKDGDCRNANNNWNRCRRLRGLTHSCRDAAHYAWLCNVQDQAAVTVAEGVLRAAKDFYDHLPSGLDPELASLQGSYEIAMGTLHTAEMAIGGLSEMDGWMRFGLSELQRKAAAPGAVKMSNITFEGSLGDQMKGGPLLLSIDLVILGKDLGRQTFAFKFDDPEFDLLQMSYIPLHLINEIFKRDVPPGLSKLMGPVFSKIVEETKRLEEQAHNEVKKANEMLKANLEDLRSDLAKDISTED